MHLLNDINMSLPQILLFNTVIDFVQNFPNYIRKYIVIINHNKAQQWNLYYNNNYEITLCFIAQASRLCTHQVVFYMVFYKTFRQTLLDSINKLCNYLSLLTKHQSYIFLFFYKSNKFKSCFYNHMSIVEVFSLENNKQNEYFSPYLRCYT